MHGVWLAHMRDRLDAAGYPGDGSTPLERLFANGQRVDEGSIRALLTSAICDRLIAMELLSAESGTLTSHIRLEHHYGFLLALDPPEIPGQIESLHVMPPSGSTRTMMQAIYGQSCDSALELGTGAGALALLMARHAGRVVATDCNPRALKFVQLSAGLNHISNVETRHGNWFEPVAGELYDQIMCNPPYIISPDSRRIYRDSGLEGDAICRYIVQGMPAHLKPGGVAQSLINWIVRNGTDPLDDWTCNSGCEVLVRRLLSYDPAGYARHWLGERADSPAFDEWMAYYRRLGIESIGSGIVTLTKPGRASADSDPPT